MKTLVYDIEADGLLDTVSKVHCIVISEVNSEVYHRHFGEQGIAMALDTLSKADYIIAHNQIGYDLRVLEKLYPTFKRPPLSKIIDTLVLSRLAYPDRPGGHSLEAWSKYFIERGLSVPEKYMINNWTDQTLEEYLERCGTDVMINTKVYEFLSKQIEPSELGREEVWLKIT